MKRTKMSLANVQERLSRAEMKQILAGDRTASAGGCFFLYGPFPGDVFCAGSCKFSDGREGSCSINSSWTKCYCVGAF